MNKWTKLILLAFVGGLVLTGLSYVVSKGASATCHQYPPDGSSNNKGFSSLDAVGFAKDLIIWTAASFVVLSVLSLTGRKK
jgi:hypothetical protein